ncbi:MAG: ribonuclease J [Mycoplasma sp.]|nr:ribonuclease J [Mycoplasma sp.]
MAKINVFALGGQDENGKNSYVIEVDEKIFVIDAGTKSPITSKLGVDTIIPSFEYIKKNINKVQGIFITHGHDESFAALPWLLISIKGLTIYATEFTVAIIKERISKYKIGHSDYKIVILKDSETFEGVKVKKIPLAHSIPGTIGLDFQTEDGSIVYLANYVLADLKAYGKTDLEEIKSKTSKKGILLLMLETSRASYVGYAADKVSVKPVIKKTFLETPDNKRIIVGAYDEEMFTLQQILDLAIETGRPVVPYGRAYALLLEMYKKLHPEMKLPKIDDYKKIKSINNAVILITGTGERLYQRFIRITEGNDVFLKFKSDDTVIMIAPPINGLEKTAAKTLDLISRQLTRIYDVNEQDYYLASPSKEDIIKTIEVLEPRNVLPIIGYYRYMDSAKRNMEKIMVKGRVQIQKNGMVMFWENGKLASTNGKIKEVGDTLIGGFGVGDLSYGVIAEKEELARDGVITVAIIMSYKTKKMIGMPHIKTTGIMIPKTDINYDDLIKSKIIQTVKEMKPRDYRIAQNRIRNRVKKALFKTINKEPMVIVTFYEV